MAKALRLVIEEKIVDKIHLVRGLKVMIDKDIAELYGVETKRLKEQVNRNLNRFPSHYMIKLAKEEYESLRSQNATLKQGAHSKYLPYAFTEHGVLMLANVLKTNSAIEMSIKIIDVFVKLREMLSTNKDILMQMQKVEMKLTAHDEDIRLIFEALKKLLNTPQEPRKRIGFKPDDI